LAPTRRPLAPIVVSARRMAEGLLAATRTGDELAYERSELLEYASMRIGLLE
jgi:hypothetical protein